MSRIDFPEGFDDWAWEAEAKGWLQGAIATIDGQKYEVTFYDPTRLAQDLAEELRASPVFMERNMLVVGAVTRSHMQAAIETIAATGRWVDMIPTKEEPHSSG